MPAESDSEMDGDPSNSHLRLASKSITWSQIESTRRAAFRWMNGFTVTAMIGLLAALFFGAVSVTVPFEQLPTLSTARLLLASIFLGGGSLGGALFAGLIATLGGRKPQTLGAGTMQITGNDVHVTGAQEQRFSKADIAQGWLENPATSKTKSPEWRVVLALRNGHQLTLQVATQSEGEELLRNLGVSVTDRVLRVFLRSTASLVPRGELFGVIGLISLLAILPLAIGQAIISAISVQITAQMADIPNSVVSSHAWSLLVATAISGLAAFGIRATSRFLQRRDVVVGADGIAIEGFAKRAFVAYDQITNVERHPRGVNLQLRDGQSLLLPTLSESLVPLPTSPQARVKIDAMAAEIPNVLPSGENRQELYDRDITRRETLLNRIEQARAATNPNSNNPRLETLLDQNNESLPAWKSRLQHLLDSPDDHSPYRIARLTSTQLAEVVEDAAATPERRIAAAIALSSSADTQVRKRVRVAVETCADDDTRAALEAAAEGELQELALERLRRR